MAEDWVFRVTAHVEESLGHFLGRFRRVNVLSHKALADHLGIRVEWVQAWEVPSRRCNPSELQQIALSKLVEVSPAVIAKMLPPFPLHLGTRLCAACYAEIPIHRAVWQKGGTQACDRHGLTLLLACPLCQSSFRLPALWEDESCQVCGLSFTQMQSHQRPAQSPS